MDFTEIDPEAPASTEVTLAVRELTDAQLADALTSMRATRVSRASRRPTVARSRSFSATSGWAGRGPRGRPRASRPPRPTRRRFPASYMTAILDELDQATAPGANGAIVRRQGLYTSHATN